MLARPTSQAGAFKRRVFQIIEKAQPGDKVSMIFDWTIIVLIFLSILTIILQSFDKLDAQFTNSFRYLEGFTVAVFTIEYLLRLWTADLAFSNSSIPRIRYFLSFLAFFDLLAILPFYLPFIGADLRVLRLFRMLRLLRLVKIKRYSPALQTVLDVVSCSLHQLLASFCVCAVIIFIAGIIMYTAENEAQPEAFPNVLASLWWAVNALTTVGYGDVYPVTVTGKFFASILSVIGVGVIAIPAGIIAAGFLKAIENNADSEKTSATVICPHCGKQIDGIELHPQKSHNELDNTRDESTN